MFSNLIDILLYIVLVSYKGWWYDGIITHKLTQPTKANINKKACLQVKLVDILNTNLKCKYNDIYVPVIK